MMRETLENLSKTTFRPRFQEEFQSLNEQVKEAVAKAIEELATNYLTHPWSHPQVKYIESQGQIWRLKVGKQGQTVDHRIFFDVDNEGLAFLSVQHRDQAYEPE